MGYVKTKQLNKKKVQYLITPKGFMEKSKKTYKYLLKSIRYLNIVSTAVSNIINHEYSNGASVFLIYGQNELADVVYNVIKNAGNPNIRFGKHNGGMRQLDTKTVLLNTQSRAVKINNCRVINVFDKILSDIN